MSKFHLWVAAQAPIILFGNDTGYSSAIHQASEDNAQQGLEAITEDAEVLLKELQFLSRREVRNDEFYEEVEAVARSLLSTLEFRNKFLFRLGYKKLTDCISRQGNEGRARWPTPVVK